MENSYLFSHKDQPDSGLVLRDRRKQLGITQEDLAYGICSVPKYSRIESGLERPSIQEFADLMALCREQYDICLVNASPIDTVTDAVEIARQCDCALFIAQHRKTHAWALSAARQQLEAVPCPVIGCVVADAKKTAPYA